MIESFTAIYKDYPIRFTYDGVISWSVIRDGEQWGGNISVKQPDDVLLHCYCGVKLMEQAINTIDSWEV